MLYLLLGNVIKPSEAISQPTLTFKTDEEECFYTLVLSNPDGHFTEDNAEYLHWMVGNIPSNANLSANNENIDSMNMILLIPLKYFFGEKSNFNRCIPFL